MKRIAIYNINIEYIEWLLQYDPNIMWPKHSSNYDRPYVGILIEINNYQYFAPLTHKGKKWLSFDDHIVLNNGQYGAICLNCMIPIHKQSCHDLIHMIDFKQYINDINNSKRKYGLLLQNQYRFINKAKTINYICSKALDVYNNNIVKKTWYYCDFSLLENKSEQWVKQYKFNFIKEMLNNFINSTI